MHVTELDSFVQKFNQLWKAGLTAHLDLDCHAGNAWVGLRVQLGPVPPGPNHHPYHHVPPPRYRGPSYSRRLEKRRAARCQASPLQSPTAEVSDNQSDKSEAVEATMKQNDEEFAEKVIQHDPKENSEVVEDLVKNNQEKRNAEKVNTSENHDCPICDFRSTWKNGLKIHMNRMHTKLEQVDGSVDSNSKVSDAKYENSAHYWERGRIGVAYHSFLDANSVIDTSDAMTEEEKLEEKTKLLEARKNAFENNFCNFSPWTLR